MIPRKIHRVWLGGDMPQEYRAFGERWAELHPSWEIKTWSEQDLEWLQNRAEFDQAEQLATKANIARYEIVLREGGMYVDTDFEPMQPFDAVLEGVSLVLGEETPGRLNNAFFAAEPGHPFLRYLVEELPSSFHSLIQASSPVNSGPGFITRCYRRWSAAAESPLVRILHPHEIYPYTYDQSHLRNADFPDALAVHHWAKSWHSPNTSAQRSFKRAVRTSAKRYGRSTKELASRLARRWAALDARPAYVSRKHVSVYVGEGHVLTNTVEGFPILSFAWDLGVTPSLVAQGTYDPGYFAFIRQRLKRGDVFVDVGANIGLFSIAAGWIVGQTGKVLAFEPNPEVHALLMDSIYMNTMQGMGGRIQALNVAAGDEQLEIELRVPRKHPGRGSTAGVLPLDEQMDTFTVESAVLDEELRLVPEIKLLKIDVEGGELKVLRGLRETIHSGRIRFLDLELIDEHAGAQWNELTAELRDIRDRAGANTYKLNAAGELVPWSVEAAIHTDRLQHFIFELPRKT